MPKAPEFPTPPPPKKYKTVDGDKSRIPQWKVMGVIFSPRIAASNYTGRKLHVAVEMEENKGTLCGMRSYRLVTHWGSTWKEIPSYLKCHRCNHIVKECYRIGGVELNFGTICPLCRKKKNSHCANSTCNKLMCVDEGFLVEEQLLCEDCARAGVVIEKMKEIGNGQQTLF